MTLCTAHVAAVEPWHRLDVCSWPALARTHVTVTGVLDTAAVEAIDGAALVAAVNAQELTLDLENISTVTAGALDALLARGQRLRDAHP